MGYLRYGRGHVAQSQRFCCLQAAFLCPSCSCSVDTTVLIELCVLLCYYVHITSQKIIDIATFANMAFLIDANLF